MRQRLKVSEDEWKKGRKDEGARVALDEGLGTEKEERRIKKN